MVHLGSIFLPLFLCLTLECFLIFSWEHSFSLQTLPLEAFEKKKKRFLEISSFLHFLSILPKIWGYMRSSPTILYLMFADDCLIFCMINRISAWYIKIILKNYYSVSGQLINYHKLVVQYLKEVTISKSRVL